MADNVYFGESKRTEQHTGGYNAPAPGYSSAPAPSYGGYGAQAPAAPSYGGYSAPSAPASDFAMLEDDDAQLPF